MHASIMRCVLFGRGRGNSISFSFSVTRDGCQDCICNLSLKHFFTGHTSGGRESSTPDRVSGGKGGHLGGVGVEEVLHDGTRVRHYILPMEQHRHLHTHRKEMSWCMGSNVMHFDLSKRTLLQPTGWRREVICMAVHACNDYIIWTCIRTAPVKRIHAAGIWLL